MLKSNINVGFDRIIEVPINPGLSKHPRNILVLEGVWFGRAYYKHIGLSHGGVYHKLKVVFGCSGL
jgi:hypothetical protein